MICGDDMKELGSFVARVSEELTAARLAHAPLHSLHEGIAVIEEEFLEFRTAAFTKNPDLPAVAEELVQLAAMCQRLYEDVLLESMRPWLLPLTASGREV